MEHKSDLDEALDALEGVVDWYVNTRRGKDFDSEVHETAGSVLCRHRPDVWMFSRWGPRRLPPPP